MKLKKVIPFIFLLGVILLFTGCDNLLKKMSGKTVGIYLQIVDDSKYLSIEDKIADKVVARVAKNKEIKVVKISPGALTQNSNAQERMKIIKDLNLDYLLVLNLYDLIYDLDFGSSKTGDLSFEFRLIDKYKLKLIYYLYDNTNFDPVYKGDSDGYFSKSRKTGAPVVASDLSYEFSMAVVNALKKTELSK